MYTADSSLTEPEQVFLARTSLVTQAMTISITGQTNTNQSEKVYPKGEIANLTYKGVAVSHKVVSVEGLSELYSAHL